MVQKIKVKTCQRTVKTFKINHFARILKNSVIVPSVLIKESIII